MFETESASFFVFLAACFIYWAYHAIRLKKRRKRNAYYFDEFESSLKSALHCYNCFTNHHTDTWIKANYKKLKQDVLDSTKWVYYGGWDGVRANIPLYTLKADESRKHIYFVKGSDEIKWETISHYKKQES